MARDRLAGVQRNYGDASAPAPTAYPPQQNAYPPQSNAYPPPSNGVIGQTRGPNPYAQQNAPPANPYVQNNQQYGQQQGYDAGGGMNGGGDFWAELSSTNALLSTLEQQIKALKSAHDQSLASTDSQATNYAAQLTEEARATREQCKNQTKRLFKLAKGDKAMKNQAEVVKQRFTALLNEHQVVEKDYRQKLKLRVERQYRIVKPDATPEEVRQVVDSDSPQVFSDALMTSNRYGTARTAYREVQERHVEIQKIEKTLTELAQMFSEMAMLVEQQDETIVNVETQAADVDHNIEAGLQQTEKAVESARKARRKKWICFWICVLILVIAGLAIGLAIGLKKN
ncbi:syntaxin 1B/2/3 [Tremella mesenterica]|uniref:Syntaxin 1B/2/3 n=1 Tax=Tremella mesenterica TaxID=5217 RepID=A0A4Q1BTM4_TREME|nr:uncharacterized protein TREMEDRAFT_74009 [Tremella mesenterica DSM 1558]EIW69049.1 hypothetical protein TREMEDRAFT_74009 [Tremella mesenterica DSM 1558]RXK41376.1 syntaxin 1B/2/3 [Tremella mesenterica]